MATTTQSITLSSLKKLVNEAYEQGNKLPLELKDGICTELLDALFSAKESKNEDGWKYFSAAELRNCPPGTIFQHETLRYGIVKQSYSMKYMEWETGDTSKFLQDDHPWNMQMKKLGTFQI